MHPKSRQVAVPIEGVLAGGRQRGDAADGETEGASLGHGVPRRGVLDRVRNVVSRRICAVSSRWCTLDPVWYRCKGVGTLEN